MASLGELLQGMAPGQNVPGYPQFQPPFNLPPVPSVAEQPMQISPPPGPTQTTAPNTLVPPGSGGAPATPDALLALRSFIDQTLASNRARWAEEDRTAYEDARGKESAGGGLVVPPEVSQPNVLKRPGEGSMPSMPAFTAGPADGDPTVPEQPSAAAAPTPEEDRTFEPSTGAPLPIAPTTVPLNLPQMLYGAYDTPMPERNPERGSATPSRGPAPTPKAKAASEPAQPSGSGGSGGGGRRSTFTPAPNTDDPFAATGRPLFDNETGRFLLQTGLNLMVPQWGGPMAQIGAAVGEGAEAVGRGREETNKRKLEERKMANEEEKTRKVGLGRKGASASSASKKLKTPGQEFAANLSPEGALFFNQRLKDLNKLDAETGESAASKMDQILAETRKVDQRARAGRGQAKSEEIPDTSLEAVAGTPQEITALNAVAGDPVQRQLVQRRLDAIKLKKAQANATATTTPAQ